MTQGNTSNATASNATAAGNTPVVAQQPDPTATQPVGTNRGNNQNRGGSQPNQRTAQPQNPARTAAATPVVAAPPRILEPVPDTLVALITPLTTELQGIKTALGGVQVGATPGLVDVLPVLTTEAAKLRTIAATLERAVQNGSQVIELRRQEDAIQADKAQAILRFNGRTANPPAGGLRTPHPSIPVGELGDSLKLALKDRNIQVGTAIGLVSGGGTYLLLAQQQDSGPMVDVVGAVIIGTIMGVCSAKFIKWDQILKPRAPQAQVQNQTPARDDDD